MAHSTYSPAPRDRPNSPRPYELSDPDEATRLLQETHGYAITSRHQGTDNDGRRYAIEALSRAINAGWTLVPPERPLPAFKYIRETPNP